MPAQPLDIRPDVSILSVLRHLNYKAWYALGEFVDNAVQSYETNKTKLEELHGEGFRLSVKISFDDVDGGCITVRDNAAGIAITEYDRAFKPAAIPLDRTGLSEFGMGMKSAACWFANEWEVRTKALAETVERTVSFDVPKIVDTGIESLEPVERFSEWGRHYTEITLRDLHQKVFGSRTLGKIREHLSSMYRLYIETGELDLQVGEFGRLEFFRPEVLEAPYFRNPTGPVVRWHKPVDFSIDNGRKRVQGWAAIRKRGSRSEAGFALFRRKRLIVGSHDDPYRPEAIFGGSGNHEFQRIFGELSLSGFEVSHTKDGFRWDGFEDEFVDALLKQIDSEEMPIKRQAAHYRPTHKVAETPQTFSDYVEPAIQNLTNAIEAEESAKLVPLIESQSPTSPPVQPALSPLALTAAVESRDINLDFRDETWRVHIEVTDDPAVGPWVEISDRPQSTGPRHIGIRFSLNHPFTVQFVGPNFEFLDPMLRIAASLAISETVARDRGVQNAGVIVRCVNDLLREVLSVPCQ